MPRYIFGIKPNGEFRTQLSYSGWSKWLSNPEEYRKKYYENIETPPNPEMVFGKKIAEMLELNDPKLAHVPRYSTPEYKIEVDIGGVPVVGYLDSYDPDTKSYLEYKTSHGADTWNPVSVAKHEQLPFYSLLIHTKHGIVDRHCKLIWLETKWVDKVQSFNGESFGLSVPELELTGEIKQFPRIIYKYERERIAQSIVDVANAITEDYFETQKS